MGFFDKMFGAKTKDDKPAIDPATGDFATALLQHQRGELDTALTIYQRLIQESPEDSLATFFAAAIKSVKGSTAEAADDLRSISQRAATNGETISAALLHDMGAVLSAGAAGIQVPAVADIIASFGDALKIEGLLQQAAVCFEISVALTPGNGNMLFKLGDTLHDLRIYDYAESVFLRALGSAPHHWGALYSYAVLLQDLGRDEEAIGFYERAVRLNPDHANSRNNFGAALLRHDRLEEALVQCSHAARLNPESPLVKINMGNIYLRKEEYETARTYFADAIALNGNLAQAYYGLATVEQLLNSEPEKIQALLLKAIELNPSIPHSYMAMGNLLSAQGSAEALQYFAKAVELNNDLNDVHKDFAKACLKQGKREEALEHLRIAVLQNPEDAFVQELLGKVEAEAN